MPESTVLAALTTPNRAIYQNPSRLAYAGALFVHSWDESVAFWETDRKAIIGEFCFLALGAMLWALIKGWEYTVNEVLLGIAVTAGPPVAAAIGLYAWGVLKAPYALNRDAQAKIKELELPTLGGDASERDEFIVLAGQLNHFLNARRADYSFQCDNNKFDRAIDDFSDAMDRAIGAPEKRARQREAAKRSHNDFTLREYGERFAKPVFVAGRRLRELGFNDAADRLGEYPKTVDDLEAIVRELEGASTALPSSPISDVAALRQDNTLLKNEVAELRAISEERHLDDDKRQTIAQVVRKGLNDFWELNKASPSWTADDKEVPIFVQLYSMENDRETIRYRDDFAKAFKSGGLSVTLGELLGTSGDQENEQFVGVVSILRGNPNNLVRPFILDALRSAHIAVNECDDWPISLTRFTHSSVDSSGVTLIIGQRR